VLGDNAATPRLIQTFPKRGYQFIAHLTDVSTEGRLSDPAAPATPPRVVEAPSGETGTGPGERGRRNRRVLAAWFAALLVVAALGAAYFARRSKPLRDRDSIVLASFQNRSGEPVFDWTLRQGLAAQLGQSPFLQIVPDERVRETLRLMGRTADDPLGHDVALEVCRRQGVKAMLEGSIARLGQAYVLALEATNCRASGGARREGESVWSPGSGRRGGPEMSLRSGAIRVLAVEHVRCCPGSGMWSLMRASHSSGSIASKLRPRAGFIRER
jgi:hypothetical protein